MSRTLTAGIGIGINYFRVMKCQGKDVGRRGRRRCLTKLFGDISYVKLYHNVAEREILLIIRRRDVCNRLSANKRYIGYIYHATF